MNSNEVRQHFLDFFASKGHQIVPSAPMVIKDDPTLMFTNAGMNQFKDIFLGNRERKYPRVADTQKCLRVSGKHNDLEEVGHDTYHHTMFEMLGNWSFGDYFKKEAIAWGWEFLADVLKIDRNRMYVTVFGGDETDGIAKDIEAYNYWKALVPEERILFGSRKDNFWEMGDTGPCGPCSEIHVDLRDESDREKIPGRELVNTGDPLVIEIWNLVFIEYNRMAGGKLIQLPARHVDTGMGFERLCMVMQKKKSNYDTDVFQPVISAISQKAGIAYGDNKKSDVAMRVIADHLRAISFAIADGQLPSNVKAGYVIRRILRRAVRYGYAFLDLKEPFIFGLVPVLVSQMGHVFPEIEKQKELVMNVIREEESAFLRTLSTGIQKFNHYIENKSKETEGIRGKIIAGAFAFELFDTYGFPIDLTQLMARELGWEVDMEGFSRGLEEQKSRSRNAAAVDTDDWVVLQNGEGGKEFIGYDCLVSEARITRYRRVKTREKEYYQLVLDKTPFYAESGGQVGDRGFIVSNDQIITVENTLKEHDLIFHVVNELPADPSLPVTAQVDASVRKATENNHSATHLLHAALRMVLGKHVEQKGSLVDENRLRFDFTHFSKMTKEEIARVEKIVNSRIRENIPIYEDRCVPVETAREMGAMALFGEKYGDTVRVIAFDRDFSVELCGGTHVPATGQIGQFKIISEGAVAAGIRRIEAITAEKAEAWYNERLDLLDEIREKLKNPKDLLQGVNHLMEENQELRKQMASFEKMQALQMKDELIRNIRMINGVKFLASHVTIAADSAKDLAFAISRDIPDHFLIFAGETEGKVHLTLMIAPELAKARNWDAGKMIRELAKAVQGGGGGQPHIATAGGKNPAGIPEVLQLAEELVKG